MAVLKLTGLPPLLERTISDNSHLQQLILHHRPVSKHNSGRWSPETILVITLGISALTNRCEIRKLSMEIYEMLSHFSINEFPIPPFPMPQVDMESLLLVALVIPHQTNEYWNTILQFSSQLETITVDNLRDLARPLRMFQLLLIQCIINNRECHRLLLVQWFLVEALQHLPLQHQTI